MLLSFAITKLVITVTKQTSPIAELDAGFDRHLRCTSQHELYVSRPAGKPDIFAVEVARAKMNCARKFYFLGLLQGNRKIRALKQEVGSSTAVRDRRLGSPSRPGDSSVWSGVSFLDPYGFLANLVSVRDKVRQSRVSVHPRP